MKDNDKKTLNSVSRHAKEGTPPEHQDNTQDEKPTSCHRKHRSGRKLAKQTKSENDCSSKKLKFGAETSKEGTPPKTKEIFNV